LLSCPEGIWQRRAEALKVPLIGVAACELRYLPLSVPQLDIVLARHRLRSRFGGFVVIAGEVHSQENVAISPNQITIEQSSVRMDGRILSSDGQYVAYIQANAIYDLDGTKLYDLKGQKIYKLTGELVGNFNTAAGDRRLDKSTDRLFPKTRTAGL
jgi:hypothetical protein